jgi:hypothetical protein
MRMKFLTAAATTLSLLAAPAMAANPAASLSVAKSARAGAPAAKKSELAGAGLFGAIIAAGVVAIGVVAIVNSEEDDDSDSN